MSPNSKIPWNPKLVNPSSTQYDFCAFYEILKQIVFDVLQDNELLMLMQWKKMRNDGEKFSILV